MLITDKGVVLTVLVAEGGEQLVHLDANVTDDGQVQVLAGALMNFAQGFSPDAVVTLVNQTTPRVAQTSEENEEVRSFFDSKLVLDNGSRQALVMGEPVRLANQEWNLLWFLSGKPNTFLTREQILSGAWPRGYVYEGFFGSRTVDVHVRRVRRGLGSLCLPTDPHGIIRTNKGFGYGFFTQSTEIDPANNII